MSSPSTGASPATLSPLIKRMRTDVCWVRTEKGKPPGRVGSFTKTQLAKHLNGSGHAYGLAFIQPGQSTCRVALLDLDSHGGQTPFAEMRAVARKIADEMELRGLAPVAFRSSGGKGIHLWLVWREDQDAYSVRKCLADVLKACDLSPGTKGVSEGEVEVFPKQDFVASDGFGNMAILPLAGESVPLDADMAPQTRDASVMWTASAMVPRVERPERSLVVAEPSVELADFRAALQAIPNDTAPLDYDAWRNVVFSIHHATGGSDEGLALAHEFSSRSGKYDPDFLDERVWPYINAEKEGGITDRFVLNLAAEHGYGAATADDFEDLEETALATKAPRFTPVHAGAYASEIQAAHWLIKDVIPAAELCVIYGESGSGKTFITLDMAMAIARGVEWMGAKVRKGRVVYIVAEGRQGFRRRLKAYGLAHDIDLDQVDIFVIGDTPSIMDNSHIAALIEAVRGIGGCAMIVLDTLAQVTAGANENSGEDMGKALRNAAVLGQAVGATVVLVHHSGKDASRGARGWSGIKGALDAELEVVRSGDDRVVSVTKQKDGEEGAEYGFRLKDVPLGIVDEEGDELHSCVVEAQDTVSRQSVVSRRALGPNENLVRDTLLALAIGSDGWVDIEDVVRTAVESLPEGERKRPSTLRRAGRALVDARVLSESNGRWRDATWTKDEEEGDD